MNNDPKYVVIDGIYGEEMYVFPNFIQHANFVFCHNIRIDVVISAGFVNMNEKKCYGKSVSLNCPSRPEQDSDLLKRLYFR